MNTCKEYSIIPRVVRKSKELNNNEKMILVTIIECNELFSKDKETGKEKKSFSYINEWLIDETQVSRRTFFRSIKHLKELGYIMDGKKYKHYELNYEKMGYEDVEVKITKMEENPLPISSEVENKEEKEVKVEKEVEKLEVKEEEGMEEEGGYSLETADDNDYTVILNIAKGESDPDKLKDKKKAMTILEEYLQSRPQDKEKMMAYLEQMYQEGEIEQDPSVIEKDWDRMNARLDGAERQNQGLDAFVWANMSDLEDSGFSREEMVRAYNNRFAFSY